VIDRKDVFALLAAHMADAETQWSLGTFGAIAEFSRDADEPATSLHTDASMSAVTARGGIRIAPLPNMRPVASETTTRESWSHRVALCLPTDQCAMSRRAVLTELGPDAEALREQDRAAILFDLGIGALQVDACVRVSDAGTAAALRAHAGRSLFEPGNPAMAVILASSPHRVFVSRLGRIEVHQPIPSPNGQSPEGPHTHVLPKLLRHGRSHAATEPIPTGWVPCAHLYPAHPAKDALGCRRAFDPARYHAFQQTLRMFGDPDLVALKQQVRAAVSAGQSPSAIAVTDNRFARTSIRVVLRQLIAAEQVSPSLSAWTEAHDHPAKTEGSDAADPHEHD
jgi:uncharacterized protein DUF6925